MYFHVFSYIFMYFSCIFMYCYVFSCIFMYCHVFSCIFMYCHVLSCIFMYFHHVPSPPVILGVTNPFFAKTLQHWPHIIRIGEMGSIGESVAVQTQPNVHFLYYMRFCLSLRHIFLIWWDEIIDNMIRYKDVSWRLHKNRPVLCTLQGYRCPWHIGAVPPIAAKHTQPTLWSIVHLSRQLKNTGTFLIHDMPLSWKSKKSVVLP